MDIYGGLRSKDGNILVDLSLFVLLYNANFINKHIQRLFKLNLKKLIVDCTNFRQSIKSLQRKKFELSKKKRVFCWSIYIIRI